jgi:tRNA (cmo5U34)-methyltransferase
VKSSVEEIRQRFDRDVERFSNLETGQTATVDAPLALELVAAAAAATTPRARRLLDIGCGAGNYPLKLLERLPGLEVTLVDLSRPMLERAEQRVRTAGGRNIRPIQGDIRAVELGESTFDVILAAAVLHHLRGEKEWRQVFAKLHRALTPSGSLWVFDMVESDLPAVQEAMRERYGRYLESLKGPEYRREVFAYIEREDTPRSLVFQLELLRTVGFAAIDVLHKNSCFAAYSAVKVRSATESNDGVGLVHP